MKKVLALILVLCLMASVLPMAVLADPTEPAVTEPATTEPATTEPAATEPAATEPAAPAITVSVRFYDANQKSFTLTLAPGTPAYVTAGEDMIITKWTDSANAPADNFVKFELVAGETAVVKATFQNFVADSAAAGGYTKHAIEFRKGETPYNVEIELIGENAITHSRSACLKYSNEGTMTITGEGSLTLKLDGAASGALWGNGGDLYVKNTTLNLQVLTDPESTNNSAHHGIFMAMGSVVLENVKITSFARGGSMVYIGTTDKEAGGGDGSGRSTPSKDVTRTITIKDCDITSTTRTGATLYSAGPAKISNSTLKLTKNSSSGKNIFVPAPEFEGDFTAIAGLAKNAEKLDKLKEYNPNKLSSYTYLYAVPGIVSLLPTEPTIEVTIPAATEPEETEPEITTPVVTQPKETEPEVTEPEVTTPATTEATTPDVVDDDTTSGSSLKIVLIVIIALIVVAGGALVALLFIRKKRA